ncbi:MAG: galactose mutarotase [Myxococcales bacterium]|nr:MAG: galactose mutarotase [Myxococcales bacterium]
MNRVTFDKYAFGCLGLLGVACSAPQQTPSVPEPAPAPIAATTPTAGADSSAPAKVAEPVVKAPYGKVDGKDVELYTLTNKNGLVLKVTNYGVIVTELWAPDRNGKLADIVGGYESVDGYVKKTPYFGATVGRVANRIKNAEFKLEGKPYKLAANNGPHSLHGGNKGWDKVIWTATPGGTAEAPSVSFTYLSKDGEEGFPGNVTATIVYTLTGTNEFKIDIEATTDKATLVNPAHHTYWMLQGIGNGGIKDQVLTIHAEKFTPGGKPPKPDIAPVPDGTVKAVEGTPFDFRKPKAIGADLAAVGGTPVGYDHFWVVDGDPKAMRPVATVKDPKSGRTLTLEADQIGVQFYAGIFLDGTITGKGVKYEQYDALCLETHAWVNGINVPAWKDAVVLKPGQKYQQHMVHRLATE